MLGSEQTSEERVRENKTHHGFEAHIVTNVICVAVIEDGAHPSIDDQFEV